MTSTTNLFSNFNGLTKTDPTTYNFTSYKKNNLANGLGTLTPALTQGDKFKKYQRKIKKNLEKRVNINRLSGKEGFDGLNLDNMNLEKNGLAIESHNIISSNESAAQQQDSTLQNLRQQYQDTLQQYNDLVAQYTGMAEDYVKRISSSNPYLGKNIRSANGYIYYVTQQGVAKWYPTMDIYNSVVGSNGCPAPGWDQYSWNSENTQGSILPTNPPLVVGTPMVAGQSCGNEGKNVFVNTMISNAETSYQGCYADNPTTPLMTFIGGSPPPAATNIITNGNFEQPQLQNDSYTYYSAPYLSTALVWNFFAILINNSTAWGFPMPYPHGSQAAVIQGSLDTGYGGTFGQNFTLGSGAYTLSFSACGRPPAGANPINIYLGLFGGNTSDLLYTFTPPATEWQTYSIPINSTTAGTYAMNFVGQQNSIYYSTAFQNIQITNSSSTSTVSNGSYTYDQCEKTAIDSGYKYFALQDVNPTNSKGYCAVSNDQPTISSLGQSTVPSKQISLWSSNTAGNTGATAKLTTSGTLSVYNSSGTAIYNTDSSTAVASTPQTNYIGCYNDCQTGRGLPTPIAVGTDADYVYTKCSAAAEQGNWKYFGLQFTQPSGTSECWVGNDLDTAKSMGVANNCTTVNGYSVGGYCSNAVYSTSAENGGSSFILALQDDGNLCIYKGSTASDIQPPAVWCAYTNGKQQQANPKYAAANGKYGQNWIASGSTLSAGDFVGSTSGNLALIMQSDGNLVLYTFATVSNCQTMSDGQMGGGVGANAIYQISESGISGNIGKLAYVDANSNLYNYPSNNVIYGNTYSQISIGMDTPGNDIPGAAYGNATLESCQTTCDNLTDCAGIVTNAAGDVCWPKTSNMYPYSNDLTPNSDRNIYIRNKTPSVPPIGVPNTTDNIDTVQYQHYVNGGILGSEYGLASLSTVQQQQLQSLRSQLDLLTEQINNYTNTFGSNTKTADLQMGKNIKGLKGYLTDLKVTDNKIKNFNTNMENILNDSDIVALQKNYDYLFWTILAAGTVLVAINLIKQ
jgi:hypothetical protein